MTIALILLVFINQRASQRKIQYKPIIQLPLQTKMSSFARHLMFLTLLVLVTTLMTECEGEGYSLLPKTHVRIINTLEDRTNLTLHCKSKDDDLGVHVIGLFDFFEFSFRPNVFGRTLYFCDMWWDQAAPHRIDIYVEQRDINLCKVCFWSVKADYGPCMRDPKTGVYDICRPWQK